MRAIYKKEFRGFMTSMLGYVFIAFLLAVCGIYFTAYHLQATYPYFAYTLQSVLFVFLILVPVLTMRVLAEERRQKTDQLLLTSPVSVEGIVLGKYLALVSVYLIALLVLAFYPLILMQFGDISLAESYTALFGFFLLGSSYLAIGLFLSSVTESQVIAAVLTFFALFVSYVMDGIAGFFPDTAAGSFFTLVVLAAIITVLVQYLLNKIVITAVTGVVLEGALIAVYLVKASFYEGLIQTILGAFSVTDHFSEFAGGMLDIQGLLYYLSVTAIFLFLTVQSIQKRRWGTDRGRVKNGSYSMALTAIVVAVCVAVNLIAAELPSKYMQIDITSDQLSVLTDQSESLLSDLDQDVTLYYIVQDGSEDSYVQRLLERYEDASSHITVEQKDPVRYPNFTSQYTSDSVSENSVIVVCGETSRVVSYDDMYSYEMDYSSYSYSTTGFDAEGQITSAIAAVSSENLPKVYTLTGHSESELSTTMSSAVEKENIELESLNLLTEDAVPEDADALLVLSPQTDLSTEETNKLLSYLMTGGKAFFITDYTGTEMPNLTSLLNYYGIEVEDGVVLEGDAQHYVQVPYYLVPTIQSTDVSEAMTGGSAYVLLAAAQGLSTSEDVRDTVTVTEVLTTSDSAYSKTDVANMTTYSKEDGDVDGPFALGMLAAENVTLTDEVLEQAQELLSESSLGTDTLAGALTEIEIESETEPEEETEDATETEVSTEAESASENAAESETDTEAVSETGMDDSTDEQTAETRIAVYTSSALVDDSASQMVSGGNQTLFVNTLSWMCGHEESVSIPVKSMSADYLTVTQASGSFWSILVIGVIPIAFIGYGLFVWLRRRKQ